MYWKKRMRMRMRSITLYLSLVGIISLAWHSVIILSHLPLKMWVPAGPTTWTGVGNISTLYNSTSGTLTVIDKNNVSFIRQPDCDQDASYIVLILSGTTDTASRDHHRRTFSKVSGVFPVFLLGNTEDDDVIKDLQGENNRNRDLLQMSLIDSYSISMYKILAGYIWVNRFCPSAKFIAKMDGNSEVDLRRMVSTLDSKYGDYPPDDTIECPTVFKNVIPFRNYHKVNNTVMSKWVIPTKDMALDYSPDFCVGWLYVTTPRVGLRLAEVATIDQEVSIPGACEDVYITGLLRQRLGKPRVRVEYLEEGGFFNAIFNTVLSGCSFLSFYRNTWHNRFVLEKGHPNLPYIRGNRYFWCSFLEVDFDRRLPKFIYFNYISSICSRDL